MAVAAALNWVVNYPHFSATLYRFYRAPESRDQFLLTAVLVPPLLLAAVVGCVVSPQGFTPYFINVMLLWSAYHYTGQNRGLTLLYARRTGFSVSPFWRTSLIAFLYATLLNQLALLEQGRASMPFFNASFTPLNTPQWFITATAWGVGLSGAVFVISSILALRRGDRMSWIMFIPVLAQLSWTVLGANVYTFLFFIPFFHGLQYLLIAWSIELHAGAAEKGNTTARAYFWRRTILWGGCNLLGGAILFYVLPRISGAMMNDASIAAAALYAAVQIHHFFVDGVIWKLRHVGNESPLLTHFSAALESRS
jgi:hypothetical protein